MKLIKPTRKSNNNKIIDYIFLLDCLSFFNPLTKFLFLLSTFSFPLKSLILTHTPNTSFFARENSNVKFIYRLYKKSSNLIFIYIFLSVINLISSIITETYEKTAYYQQDWIYENSDNKYLSRSLYQWKKFDYNW